MIILLRPASRKQAGARASSHWTDQGLFPVAKPGRPVSTQETPQEQNDHSALPACWQRHVPV